MGHIQGSEELPVQFAALAGMAVVGLWAANRRFRRMLG